MSIAWRAILVAGLAAGEEATLASLTGLFQREPDRAAALRDGVGRPNLLPHRSPFTSTHFGSAASNLMLTVALKLKNGDRIPDELRPENHSPLGATRFEKSVKTHGPAHAHHPVQEASVDTPTAFEGEWL